MAEITLLGFQDLLDKFPPNVITKACVRAMKRTTTSIRAEIARRVREQLNLKIGDIKESIHVQSTTIRDASSGEVVGEIRVSGKRTPLIKFDARSKVIKTDAGPRIGVTVNVKGQRKAVRGAFIATMQSGKTGIFKRQGRQRLPIEELFSSSVASVVERQDFLDGLGAYVEEKFNAQFEQDVNYFIEREIERLSR